METEGGIGSSHHKTRAATQEAAGKNPPLECVKEPERYRSLDCEPLEPGNVFALSKA